MRDAGEGAHALGERAFAAEAGAEAGVIELPAAHGTNPAKYAIAAAGSVIGQPLFEDRGDGPG